METNLSTPTGAPSSRPVGAGDAPYDPLALLRGQFVGGAAAEVPAAEPLERPVTVRVLRTRELEEGEVSEVESESNLSGSSEYEILDEVEVTAEQEVVEVKEAACQTEAEALVEQLCEEMEISRRTAQEDMAALRAEFCGCYNIYPSNTLGFAKSVISSW